MKISLVCHFVQFKLSLQTITEDMAHVHMHKYSHSLSLKITFFNSQSKITGMLKVSLMID